MGALMDLLQNLHDKARRKDPSARPLVLVSLAPVDERPRIDLDDLLDVVADRAAVAVLGSSRLGFDLGDEVPQWRCSGGAIRVFYPSGRPGRAIVTRDGDDPRWTLDQLDDELGRWAPAAAPASSAPSPGGPPGDLLQRDEAEAQTEAASPSRSSSSTSAELLEADSSSSSSAPAPSLVSGSAPSPPQNDVLCNHLDEITDLKGEILSLKSQISALKSENRSLDQRLAGTLALLHPIVHSDEEEQLRFEIGHHYLVSNPETERKTYPIRAYTIGADFLDSLTELGNLATRERVVAVVCDVLTRRAYEMPSRYVHPHARAGGPTLVREHDSATAFRCAVKTESPGAARLLWWELVDGTVELGRVAHHDDYSLR